MAVRPGTHTLGPENGSLRVNTYREGMAQKAGHDLLLEVAEWHAQVDVDAGGTPTAVSLEADPRSLQVLEGRRGVKPLTDKDRAEIRSNIDEQILKGQAIGFRSSSVELAGGRLRAGGELSMAGSSRPARFELSIADDGRVRGTVSITQSEWGIKPYRAFMGALKVRDAVEVTLDVKLPTE